MVINVKLFAIAMEMNASIRINCWIFRSKLYFARASTNSTNALHNIRNNLTPNFMAVEHSLWAICFSAAALLFAHFWFYAFTPANKCWHLFSVDICPSLCVFFFYSFAVAFAFCCFGVSKILVFICWKCLFIERQM